VSYYAAMQWRVATKNPKGLCCMIPWEGLSDCYRDLARHGGIMSNNFLETWFIRQVKSNAYGLPGRAARNWGEDTIEGDLTPEELDMNTETIADEVLKARYTDDPFFATRELKLEDITIPFLSVGNWGSLGIHLRGNVDAFLRASSKLKYLRFLVGRHDLPFFYDEEVAVQLSFLNAFLKENDPDPYGWRSGKAPRVDMTIRKGDAGINNAALEKATFHRRIEDEWPIARTQYTRYYLHPSLSLSEHASPESGMVTYVAPNNFVNFTTAPFEKEVEITGHIVTHLNVSCSPNEQGQIPTDMDVFVCLQHFDKEGREIMYTDSSGNPASIIRGWLRVSLRAVNEKSPLHTHYLPRREYSRTSLLPVRAGEIYAVDIELWPTNVVIEVGETLALAIGAGDIKQPGAFTHISPIDRNEEELSGKNHIHFGPDHENFITLPIIPPKTT